MYVIAYRYCKTDIKIKIMKINKTLLDLSFINIYIYVFQEFNAHYILSSNSITEYL